MIKKLSFFILVLTSLNAGAQNQNWIATGIDGNTYNIDSIVNTGKTVLVDISANWCAPCWDFHITGIMEKLYHEFGPEGTDDLFIIFVDGDPTSSMVCKQRETGLQQRRILSSDHTDKDLQFRVTML